MNESDLQRARDALAERLRRRNLPEHGITTLVGYVVDGWNPGGFMQAVLSNDFIHAAMHADGTNRHHLFDYAVAMHNDLPHGCWGTPDAVIHWLDIGGYAGMDEDDMPEGAR